MRGREAPVTSEVEIVALRDGKSFLLEYSGSCRNENAVKAFRRTQGGVAWPGQSIIVAAKRRHRGTRCPRSRVKVAWVIRYRQ